MDHAVMEYAVNVAERLEYSIFAAYVDTLPLYRDGGRRSRAFSLAVQESSETFRTLALARNVRMNHVGESGKIGNIVSMLCHSDKRIEFVIIDRSVRLKEIASRSPVPVFTVRSTHKRTGPDHGAVPCNPINEGVLRMASSSRKRHVKNCFIFGAASAAVYAAVFTHQAFVMTYFTKGGLYALLPVALVFTVSYAHGNFTSSFWSALGIEGSKIPAAKRTRSTQTETDSPSVRKDARPLAELRA